MNDSIVKKMTNRYQNSKITEQTKIREILQQTALLGLKRHGFFEKAAFYGGTALRILHGLDRFSEDLDFTLLKPDPEFDFTPFLDGIRKELASFGFELEVYCGRLETLSLDRAKTPGFDDRKRVHIANMDPFTIVESREFSRRSKSKFQADRSITQKVKTFETSIISAFLKMNTIKLYLAIGDEKRSGSINHNEKIQIKLEVDIDPPSHFRVEEQMVLNPISFYVSTLHRSDLFAGKMHAILYRAWKGRVKGRDWYDLIWYIQNKIPMSRRYLEECMRQAKNLGPEETLTQDRILEMLRTKIQGINWESAKADMRSFISDPERLEIWSSQFFSDLIEHLLVE